MVRRTVLPALCSPEYGQVSELQADSGVLYRLWSLCDLDRVKGRFLDYSLAVLHLHILITEMQHLMCPVALSTAYDSPRPLPAGLADIDAEISAVVERFGLLGTQLWTPVASSAYASKLFGEEEKLFC